MASLIGKALALRNQGGPPVPLGSPRFTGIASMMGGDTDEANMRAYGTQGTVYANVSLLAGATAAPEWSLYRTQPQDGRRRYTTNDQGSDQRVQVVQHQALSVLTTPASIMVNGTERVIWSRFALFELSQIWMETTGKSYWVVQRDPRATFPVGLWPVRPDRMQPVPDPENYLAGWVYTAPDGREKIPLGVDEVIFNRYPDPLDIYGGVGPIQSVLTDVDSSRYAAEWNRNYFINSAEPGGIIQVEGNLDDNEFKRLTDQWRQGHKGVARAHRVAVLEGGQQWVPNSHTLRDMDFNNLRSTGRDIIREALGMHKVMTGVTDDVNRANAQTGEEVFASWKIKPRLDRWKDVINTQFLPLFGSTAAGVEFDYSFPQPLNREQDNEELAAKSQAAQVLVTAGYDPHDVLEVVGLPDMDVVEKATQAPALPPGWVPGMEPGAAPGAAPAGAGDDETATAAGQDEMTARLRKVLANGHMPVLTGEALMPETKPFRTTRTIANLRKGRNDWYSIKAQADGPTLVRIFDEVGYFGVTAKDFTADLAGIKGPIELHLNTPGGEVFDGIAIYNALKQHDDIVGVVIDSLAASIGSVIAMAADPGHLIIAKNASMMIHDGFGMGIGNAADLRQLADLLDKTSDNIASIYADRTGQPAQQWRDAMLAETWYTGQEAVDAGLADFVQGSEPKDLQAAEKIAATWDLSIFARAPRPRADAGTTGDAPADTDMHGDHERVDPDGDGDCDACPEGDTDNDYWSADGQQLQPLPGKPMSADNMAAARIRAAADKYDADDRKQMASDGRAMPDGSYPIDDAEDLGNAIHAVGRGGADHDAIRRHVIKRADALGLSSHIPDNWNSDGSLKDDGTTNRASTSIGLSPEALANAMAALKELQ